MSGYDKKRERDTMNLGLLPAVVGHCAIVRHSKSELDNNNNTHIFGG